MEKLTVSDALNEIIRFKNVFRAAERIEEALATVATLQGESARLMREVKEAEAERVAAIEGRDKAKALLEQVQARLEQAQAGFDAEVEARREKARQDIADLKAQAQQHMDKIRTEHEEEVKRYFDGLKEKASKL